MSSNCTPVVTATGYHKLSRINSIDENGVPSTDLEEEATDKFEEVDDDDVFPDGQENEDRCASPTSPTSPEEEGTSKPRVRKRSVLKREGESKPKNGRQKRVSFSSISSERKRRVSNAMDCFSYMRIGTEFTKVRPIGRQYQRFYQLDDTMEFLHWQPSSKKPEKAILSIDVLHEVRVGRNTAIFKEQSATYSEDCCFSIVFGPVYETIDLVAKTSDEANIWVTGLRLLITQRTGIRPAIDVEDEKKESTDTQRSEEIDLREKWLREEFRLMTRDTSGAIDEKAVLVLLKKLWVNPPLQVVKQKFQETASNSLCNSPNKMDEDDFCKFFIDLTTRQEIYFLLVKYSSNGLYLTADDLTNFLETEQGVTCACKEISIDIINRCEPSEEGRQRQILGLDGLTKYFSDEDCDIFDPRQKNVCEDMTKPLAHYFIATSNNFYNIDREDDKLPDMDRYVSSLKSGCRCIEVNCWDGTDEEPIVADDQINTSNVYLYDLLFAINEYAFVTTEYPLLLYLESHCSVKQHNVISKYIQTVFGGSLGIMLFDNDYSPLPTLASLKGKIVAKITLVTDGNVKRNPELSELVDLCRCSHFGSPSQNHHDPKHWEICPIGEATARRLCQTCPDEFVSYNKRRLSHIYPGSQRVDGSNFNPVEFWNCGSQLVALNYQYPGLAMDLNRGRFSKNGNCGFVLKPAVMREEVSCFSPSMKNVIPGVSPLTLQVKIISGYQLPKPRGSTSKGDALDPYVMVELYGLPADCHYERSRTIPHNGYNPVFDESFEFRVILPELALLRFVVLDDDHIGDCFIGQYTICVDCIREGYRTVYLLSSAGECLAPSSLFVHISFVRESEMTAKMRGFSLSKQNKKKENTSLKTLGMKILDDTFKASVQPLREATCIRENFQFALNEFKECCGLTQRSNIKQCIRVLFDRMTTSNFNIVLNISEEVPNVIYEAEPSPVLQKIIETLEAFLRESRVLLAQSGDVYEKLNHGRRSALEWHGDLQKKCAQEGFNERRTHKVKDSFSWNIKLLSGQANLLNTAKQHCEDCVRQIKDVARTCNLVPIDQAE